MHDEQQPLLQVTGSSLGPSSHANDPAGIDSTKPTRPPSRIDLAEADISEAHEARHAEHTLSIREAASLYPGAIFWSLFFSLGVIMHAFDAQLLGNLYATPGFQHDFGRLFEGNYIIPAAWQGGLSLSSPLGQIFGSIFAAYPMEWYGRKKTLGVCVLLTTGCVFIQFFAKSLPVLLVGELLGGLVLGTYIVIAPAYASEVCPLALRGILTSCTNICFVAGQLLANCVVAGTSKLNNHWSYSLPFAVQWVWPVIILGCLPFAPESPWWLQRQGSIKEAEEALRQLASPGVNVKSTLAMIIETDRLERSFEAGSGYVDCLKDINLRRTEIAAGVYCIQVLAGIYLVGYATYFFELAGLPVAQAFNMGIGFLALGFIGTCISWPLLAYFGRRQIYLIGLGVLAVLQIMIGVVDCAPKYDDHPIFPWSQAWLMLVWNFAYGCSLGPICYVILCEVSASRVRSKTIAIATAMQAILGIVMAVTLPYLFNKDELNARGKVGFLFGASAFICLWWAWLRVPELKGRTCEELDLMFEKRLKTRDFKDYVFD